MKRVNKPRQDIRSKHIVRRDNKHWIIANKSNNWYKNEENE